MGPLWDMNSTFAASRGCRKARGLTLLCCAAGKNPKVSKGAEAVNELTRTMPSHWLLSEQVRGYLFHLQRHFPFPPAR
eukprot:Skav201112  [mRNA]  locus=scaffold185:188509:188742:+ [translate_table: standard]